MDYGPEVCLVTSGPLSATCMLLVDGGCRGLFQLAKKYVVPKKSYTFDRIIVESLDSQA